MIAPHAKSRNSNTQDATVNASDLPDLIPVRMLNEFAYCPRLGYLEFVHGEWDDNFETMNGSFGHRRVDKPDRQTIQNPAATVQSSESSAQSEVAIDSSDEPKRLGELGDSDSTTS